ncbi:MAG: hypothetical protein MI754_03330 [Chromatiales bacterium]|nr:hypothetical protein [Chromatiales bacterium]
MSKMNDYSDELINAFVDGELSQSERAELLSAAAQSKELSHRICQAQRLKEMVKTAYPENGEDRSVSRSANGKSWLGYVAASILGAVSMSLFFTATKPPIGTPPQVAIDKDVQHLLQDTESSQPVVFHISSDNPVPAQALFEQLEYLLREYANNNRPIRVEVVANNQGLRLLQKGRSPFAQRVAALHSRYPNLIFAACGNTMERMQRESGETIEVLPQAVIVRSGVSFVTRRQQQGWAYIKA